MMKTDFVFNIGEKVKISAIDMKGRVDAMMVDSEGQRFRVIYWNEGRRYSEWMYEWEIE